MNDNETETSINMEPEVDQSEGIILEDDQLGPADPDSPHMPVKNQLAILVVVLLGVFSVGATPVMLARLGNDDNVGTVVGSVSNDTAEVVDETNPFTQLNLLAKAALVIDVRDGEVLFAHGADEVLPLASVTKLMTVLLASELVGPDNLVTITAEAVAQDGDSGLLEGEVFRFSDLSDLTILTSANDGAYALAYAAGLKLDKSDPATAFVKAMNVRAKELNLSDTYFRNPTGLDLSEDESGAYGTANDVAKLLTYILANQPAVLEKTTKLRGVIYNVNGQSHQVANTNTVVNAIPNLIGSKTGYTVLSGGNLAVAFDVGVGHPVVIVVLGSTHQGRLSDVLQLVEAAQSQLQ